MSNGVIMNYLEPETNPALKTFLAGRGISGFFVPADEIDAGNDGLFSKVLVAFRSDKAIAAEFFWLLSYISEDGFDVDDLMAYGGRHIFGVHEAADVLDEYDVARHRAFLHSFVRVPFSALNSHWHQPIFCMPAETSLDESDREIRAPLDDIQDNWAQILANQGISAFYQINANLPRILIAFGDVKNPAEYAQITIDERLRFYCKHIWGFDSKNSNNAERAELLGILENALPCRFRSLDLAFQHLVMDLDWIKTLDDVRKNHKKGV